MVLVVTLDDPGRIVVIVVMGHQHDIGRDPRRSDTYGFSVVGIRHHCHIPIGEFEARILRRMRRRHTIEEKQELEAEQSEQPKVEESK